MFESLDSKPTNNVSKSQLLVMMWDQQRDRECSDSREKLLEFNAYDRRPSGVRGLVGSARRR
jgi:hypothetical protein